MHKPFDDEIENKKYEISKARAKELKAKGYVDIN